MKRSLRILALLAACSAAACDDLPALQRNQCGNTIIEQGEDCDGAGVGDNPCNEVCRVECSESGACPTGWGCGADGLCRQPTGLFVPLGNTVLVSAEKLDLADVDGDGRDDVVATRGGSVSVVYADPVGLSPETTDIALSVADSDLEVPSAGDVDGDGRADLVLRLGGSLGVLRGQADRSLAPRVFSRRLQVPVADGDLLFTMSLQGNAAFLKDALGHQLFAIGETGISVVHVSDDAQLPDEPLLTWPQKKPVFLGQLYGLIYGFEGDPEIHWYYPLTLSGGAAMATWNHDDADPLLASPSTLPDGFSPTGAAFLVNLGWKAGADSGYDQNTMVVTGQKDGEARLFMGFLQGDGFGSFPASAAPVMGLPDTSFRELARTGPEGAGDAPFFVGDADGDGAPDFAGPGGLFHTTCPTDPGVTEVCPLEFVPDPPLSPVPVDYLLTEVPDVGDTWRGYLPGFNGGVVVTTEKPGFIVYRQPGEPDDVKRFPVPTASPVKHPTLGDFNGDGVQDLVFSQRSRRAGPEDPTRESLHVSFGNPLGLPTDPVDLGDVGEVTQILKARLFPAKSGTIAIVPRADGVDDIVVRARTGDETLTYVFAGGTDGQIQSPLDLQSACQGSSAPAGVPRFSATVSLGDGDRRDVAVIYRREAAGGGWEYDLWSASPASSDSESICASLVGPAALPDPGGTALSMVPIDLDGDGADEVLIFAEGSSTLLSARLSGGAWSVAPLDLGGPFEGLAVTPVFGAGDGDRQDVVLWSAEEVKVLINDGSGTLDPAGAAGVSIAGATCGEGSGPAGITGVAAVFLHPDAGRELVVLTETGAFVVEIADRASGELGPPACSPALPGGSAATSGDVDGDGVEDLVIARPGGVQVLAGIPVVR
jgi:hypothetical protein